MTRYLDLIVLVIAGTVLFVLAAWWSALAEYASRPRDEHDRLAAGRARAAIGTVVDRVRGVT